MKFFEEIDNDYSKMLHECLFIPEDRAEEMFAALRALIEEENPKSVLEMWRLCERIAENNNEMALMIFIMCEHQTEIRLSQQSPFDNFGFPFPQDNEIN